MKPKIAVVCTIVPFMLAFLSSHNDCVGDCEERVGCSDNGLGVDASETVVFEGAPLFSSTSSL